MLGLCGLQEQLLEHTFLHLMFPVRGRRRVQCGKVPVQSQQRRSSSQVAAPFEANRQAHSGYALSVHKEWQPEVAARIGKEMADRSLLFSFVSVDSSSSSDERKTSLSVHRGMSHEIDTQLLLVSFLSLSLSLSSLSRNSHVLSSPPSLPFHVAALCVRHRRERSAAGACCSLASNHALPALDTSYATCCYWRRLLGKYLARWLADSWGFPRFLGFPHGERRFAGVHCRSLAYIEQIARELC